VVDEPDRGDAVVIAWLPTPPLTGPAVAAFVGLSIGAIGAIARPCVIAPTRLSRVAPSLEPVPPLATTHAITSGTGAGAHPRRLLWLIGAVAAAWVVGLVAIGVAASAAFLLRRVGAVRAERRRRATIDRALPDAMDRLVLSVRAGLTPFQAVCDLAGSRQAEIRTAFGEVVRRTERGQPFADALAALADHLGNQASGLADVIATSDRHGLPLGPVLDQLTVETRATRRLLDQADARKLPVRLSFPLVTCTLPSFVLLAIAPAVIAALSSLGGTAW
jgi:tight adherence protein C